MSQLDPTFLALPLSPLTDAALSRAAELGSSHADFRIERIRSGIRSYRDRDLQTSQDDEVLGLSVRVLHDGVWGFAAGITLTADAAATLAERAVATARVSKPLTRQPIELADEPVHSGSWVSAYEIDPTEVPESERQARMSELIEALLAADGVSHTAAELSWVHENKYFANLAGSVTTQQRIRIQPQITAVHVGEQGFSSMRTLAAPAGRGWEYLTGTGWDFDAEIAELPSLLAAHVAAPSVEPGRYDLVVDPTNLWLTIHESIAHATELDRALGYEAAYAGTTFATVDQLGTLHYGSELLDVTGDRTTEHGLSTVGWDDEGVAAQDFDIITAGTLVGYQLNRQMAPRVDADRSNGCAFADSPGHIPLQRMPNVSLRPPPNGPTTEELISGVERGIYVLGDNSWSIDMQRYNFQFTGQRFFRIEGGRLAGQLRDVAYQATTTDFWRSLVGLGGPQTYYLGGAFNCGKGQPGQTAPVSHGAPAALFHDVNILNTRAEGEQLMAGSHLRPAELVERALEAATLPCVAVLHESSEANLRWAGNALTTNGEMTSRTLTVTATAEVSGGRATGTVSRQVSDLGDLADLVEAAEAAARSGPASPDAAPPVEGEAQSDWDAEPEVTSIEVLGRLAGELGGAFDAARTGDLALYGFAEHLLTTSYLGASTGLRRRGVQPTGRLELNGKSDAGGSAWVGRATRDFTDVAVPALVEEVSTRLGWGERRLELAPGRYETLLPPGPVADLMIYAYWTANAQDAEEGRNVYAGADGETTAGQRLAELPITLRSDPDFPGLECQPFVDFAASADGTGWAFDTGLPIRPVNWLTDGVHTELIRNRGHAARTGRQATPPPDNLIMEADGTGSLAEMIAGTERGLLLTCLWYIREVDPERLLLTGLTRDGVYLVEGGEVVGAVNNFRFNESPVDLLRRITEIGVTERVLCREWNDFFNRTAMPAVRVPDFNMSTVSPAS